jgi:hypothetical protein
MDLASLEPATCAREATSLPSEHNALTEIKTGYLTILKDN